MKILKSSVILVVCAFLTTTSCHNSKTGFDKHNPRSGVVVSLNPEKDRPLTGQRNFIPMAQVYRTNGDYNNNVSIQTNADKRQLISFPAPSDLTPDSKPLPLADGYLLDRRGVSPYNTSFTTYTYDQYAALPTAPSVEELMKSIIPQATITRFVYLPFTLQEALADTAAVNKLIRSGFPNCQIVIEEPVEGPAYVPVEKP